jgi:hypothetical protein
MIEPVTIKTRPLYLISNIFGILIVAGLTCWLVYLSYHDGQIDFRSVLFWLAVFQLTLLPYFVRRTYASKKSVRITDMGIHISYRFKQETTFLNFSDVKELTTMRSERETVVRPASITASLTIVLKDGSVFDFDRSEFTDYGKLKAVVLHVWKNREVNI